MTLQSKILINAVLAAAIALPIMANAQNRPVKLSINGSAQIAFKPNGAGADGQSIAYYANDDVAQARRRTLQLRLAEPMLCADSTQNTSDSNVRLRLVDSNNLVQTSLRFSAGNTAEAVSRGLQGLEAYVTATDTGGMRLRIDPADSSKRVLNLTTKSSLRCFVFPAGVASNIEPVADAKALSGDTIFANGFEDIGTTNGLDLVTTITAPGTILANADMLYSVRVQNNGNGSAAEVQVRDFYPREAGGATPGLLQGSWTCSGTGGASCSETGSSTDPYMFQSEAFIPAGGALVFNITRRLGNSPAPGVGSTFRVQAAAFSRPTDNEVVLANNAASSNLISVSNNSPPSVTITSNPTQSQGACPIGGTTICRIVVTVADDQTPVNSINVSAASLTTGLDIDSVSAPAANPNQRRVDYQLAPSFAGNATIRVQATDASGGSTQLDIPVTVSAPNAPPVVSWSASCPATSGQITATFAPPVGATPATLTLSGTGDPYECNPVATVSPGPAFEAGQTVSILSVTGANTAVIGGSNVITIPSPGAGARAVRFNGFVLGNGTVNYVITLKDNGGVASGGMDTTVTTLRVIKQ
jgi:hypothetical protein